MDLMTLLLAKTQGGGASSWNDLTDKPFGETTTYGDTLTWDGDTSGLEFIDMDSDGVGDLYKVADAPQSITVDEIINGFELVLVASGATMTITHENFESMFGVPVAEAVVALPDNKGVAVVNYVMIATEDIEQDGLSLPKGVWFINASGTYAQSLTINGYNGFETTETVPLPNKYLDFIETVGGDTLTWDGDTEGLVVDTVFAGEPIYLVSKSVPTVAEASNGAFGVVGLGDEGDLIELEFAVQGLTSEAGVGLYVLAAESLVGAWCALEDVSIEGVGTLEKGVYFVEGLRSLTINGYTGFPKEQVKEEYLPSNVLYVSSLSSDSTDKYLYTDKTATTKATREDVLRCLKGGSLVISVLDNAYLIPVVVYDFVKMSELNNVDMGEHCEAECLSYDGTTVSRNIFYTSEYTG